MVKPPFLVGVFSEMARGRRGGLEVELEGEERRRCMVAARARVVRAGEVLPELETEPELLELFMEVSSVWSKLYTTK
jgi:hypothetical protein